MSRVVGLLRTEDPVVLRLTEQPAAALRVTDAPVRLALTPAAATLLVTDRQGPAGPRGEQGEPGEDAGFGQLRVADMHVDPEDYFAAGARQQLIFTPDPAQTQDFLRDPFTAVTWAGNRIVPRANGYGDWQDIIVNLLVMPAFAGGSIIADLDVGTGSTATPVQTAFYGLRGSGTPERATFRLGLQTLDGFQANGARIFLTGTVPFIVQSESIVYLPINIGPGHP